MYPVLFRIGSFEITSFGVLVALGALAGLWVFRREIARRRLMEQLKTKIRHVPDFPKAGILFYDVTTLFRDPEGFRLAIDRFLSREPSPTDLTVTLDDTYGALPGITAPDRDEWDRGHG